MGTGHERLSVAGDGEWTQWVLDHGPGATSQRSGYTPLKTLHRIQCGRVLLCMDEKLKKVVCMKQCLAKLCSNGHMLEARAEMRILGSITHPNIVPLLAAFEDAGSICLVMEYASNGDLFQIAGRYPKRQLPEKIACSKVMLPLCQAVAFLHSRGIIHRDIKPENVVVDANGILKLCDFGLAIATADEVPVDVVGTLEFMAPELLKLAPLSGALRDRLRKVGMARYSVKVDVWALGCLAFEMLLGRSPFLPRGAGCDEVKAAILAGIPQLGSLPTPVSSSNARRMLKALRFVHAALTYNATTRPSAEQLLGLEWLAAANGDGDGSTASDSGNAPSDSTSALDSDKHILRGVSDAGFIEVHERVALPRDGLGDPEAKHPSASLIVSPVAAPSDEGGGSTVAADGGSGVGASKQLRGASLDEPHVMKKLLRPRRITMPSIELDKLLGCGTPTLPLVCA